MLGLPELTHRRWAVIGSAVVVFASLTAPAAAAGTLSRQAAGPPNTFVPVGSMQVARAGQTATLLKDGDVLVAGGGSARAELYDPATRAFTATGAMPVAVTDATATLLPSGQVLVAGGAHGFRQVTNAELYDPATGTWTATGAMNVARSGQTATLLPDGDVLVAGGGCNPGHGFCNAGSFLNTLRTAELYDPATGSWALTGTMHVGRQFQTATLLPGGQVLEAGGFSDCDDDFCYDTRTAELYDPSTGTWTSTGPMHAAREQQTATLLRTGQVLVAGGYNEGGGNRPFSYSSAELYNPATGTWTQTAPMAAKRYGQTATLLPNGWVLVAGGHTAAAEIYQPRPGIWVSPGAMSTARTGATATLLPGGHVLVAGGAGPDGSAQASAEMFLAGPGPLVAVTPGSLAFGGQQTGSTSAGRTFTVSNEGSADLHASGVEVTGRDPGDFLASTDCTAAPVAPGQTCTVTVRFAPTSTSLRTAVVSLADNAPRSPQPVTVTGYGGGPYAWVPVGPLPAATENFSAVALPDGRALIAGGQTSTENAIANAELYNPATRRFTPTGALSTARGYPAAALLPDGQVLIAGGYGNKTGPLSSAELYNPATGTWRNTTPMHAAGYAMTATLLPDGDVLVTGFGGTLGNRGEVYHPATATWTNTGVMPSVQGFAATATLLKDGQVLVTGGATSAAELYDPAANAWTATAAMHVARQEAMATRLPDGDVLVAGGTPPDGQGATLSSAEVYNPAKGTWARTGSMNAARYGGTATLLTTGTVMVTGGCTGCGNETALASTEFFGHRYWTFGPSMTQPRVFQTATLLASGDVLVAGGGTCYYCAGTDTAELFTPSLLSASPARGPAGQKVTLTGSGFYAHEDVRLTLNGTRSLGHVRASAAGAFTAPVTVPQVTAGRYTLYARGSRSFTTASAAFTVTG